MVISKTIGCHRCWSIALACTFVSLNQVGKPVILNLFRLLLKRLMTHRLNTSSGKLLLKMISATEPILPPANPGAADSDAHNCSSTLLVKERYRSTTPTQSGAVIVKGATAIS